MLCRKRTCVGNWLKCIHISYIVIYTLEVQSAAECVI